MQDFGRYLIFGGLIVVLVGIVIYLGWGRAVFGWMGHLPGDFRIERDGFRFYFPLSTGIILSIALTIILRLFMFLRGI